VIAIEGSQEAKTALVVSDGKRGPTATQMISFGQPFASATEMSPCRIVFEQHYADPADIEKAFAAHSPDLLVLSRYTSDRGRDWIRLAREAGIPVIFHIDDDLLAVPASLGEAKFNAYNNPERLQALRNNIAGSDLLYVSTPELAKRFHEHRVGTPIIAGDVYCAVSKDQVGALVGPADGPVIGYMGTAGHAADLAMVLPAVCDLMEAIPSLQFEVFGTIKMPPELERFGIRARQLPPVANYAEFLSCLRSLGWWVGLAPLEDNAFNRCKADTKWVEYSTAGMAVVASDLPVYHRACANGSGILASSTSDWSDAVVRLLHDPRARQRTVETAQNKLRETYSHERLREQVMKVFEQASAIARG
jgi:glycosyltransferase involved in cell wall biosynthesis